MRCEVYQGGTHLISPSLLAVKKHQQTHLIRWYLKDVAPDFRWTSLLNKSTTIHIWQSNNEKIKTIFFVWFKELSIEMLTILIKTWQAPMIVLLLSISNQENLTRNTYFLRRWKRSIQLCSSLEKKKTKELPTNYEPFWIVLLHEISRH